MTVLTDEETVYKERRNLEIDITRTENIVSIIRASFKTDDYQMVMEMCRHLTASCDEIYARAVNLGANPKVYAGEELRESQ